MGDSKKESDSPDHVGDKTQNRVGRTYELMEYYFHAAVTLNAVPFTYNGKRFKVDPTSTKYRAWLVLMFAGIVVEWAQMTWELLRAKRDINVSRGEWSLIYFVFIGWNLLLSLHTNTLLKNAEVVNHLNKTVHLRQTFSDAFAKPSQKDEKLVRAHIWASCSQCFFQSLMVAVEGYKSHFLYSNIPEENRNFVTAGLWTAWGSYRVMTNFLGGYFYYFVGMLHVQTCYIVLKLR